MEKINNAENPKLKLVHTDKLGNKWYGYVDALEIDAIRGIAAQTADRYVSLMISQDELQLALESCVKSAKENDHVSAYAVIFDLKYRNKMLCEANSLLDLAGIYFMLEDEDPTMYMQSFKLKKQKLWDDDLICRDFFLRKSLGLTKELSNIPIEDLLTTLEKTKVYAERMYRHIPRPSER